MRSGLDQSALRRAQQGHVEFARTNAHVIDLTREEDTGVFEPTVERINAVRAMVNKSSPVAASSSSMPMKQDREHTAGRPTTNAAHLAQPQPKAQRPASLENDEEDLRLDQMELRIRNQLLQNQLRDLQTERKLRAIWKRKTKPQDSL